MRRVELLIRSLLLAGHTDRPSTLARDESVLRLHLLPVLGDRTLASLTPTDIQRLAGGWSERAAPRTVRRQYDVVRALLRGAVETDPLVRSPCRGIKLPALAALARPQLGANQIAALAAGVGSDYAATVWLEPSSACAGASAPPLAPGGSTWPPDCSPSSSRPLGRRTGAPSSAHPSPRPAIAPSASQTAWSTCRPPTGSAVGSDRATAQRWSSCRRRAPCWTTGTGARWRGCRHAGRPASSG
jgi:hypothetical protein